MTSNRFFVRPGTDIAQGLSGLTQTINLIGERKREDEVRTRAQTRFETAKEEITAAYRDQDADQLAELSIKYPEFQKVIQASLGTLDEGAKRSQGAFMREVLANPENADAAYQRRITQLGAQGRDATQTQQSYQDYLANPEAEIREMRMTFAGADPESYKAYEKTLPDQFKMAEVQSSKILPDGSVVTVMKDGSTRVVDSLGNQLEGQARAEAVKKAEEFGIDIQTRRAGGRVSATAANKRAEKAFDNVEKIRVNIRNIDNAIAQLDAGASTGPVVSMLPSITQASVELDNIQKRMGLDVIGTTTFGALSKGELDLALSTALPTNLQPEALREWLVKKRDAQEKLSNYLMESAIFLGTPGNTTADWYTLQKAKSESAEKEATQKPASDLSNEELFQ